MNVELYSVRDRLGTHLGHVRVCVNNHTTFVTSFEMVSLEFVRDPNIRMAYHIRKEFDKWTLD